MYPTVLLRTSLHGIPPGYWPRGRGIYAVAAIMDCDACNDLAAKKNKLLDSPLQVVILMHARHTLERYKRGRHTRRPQCSPGRFAPSLREGRDLRLLHSRLRVLVYQRRSELVSNRPGLPRSGAARIAGGRVPGEAGRGK